MSDEPDISPIQQAIADGAEPEPVGVPEQPVEPSPAADDTEELILGKFKTQDDLVSAYRELENKMRDQGAPREPDPEPEPDPLSYLPPYVDDHLWTRVAAWAQGDPEHGVPADPRGAALWALANPNQLGPQLTQMLENHWAQSAPAEYQRFLFDMQMAQHQPQGEPEPSMGDQYALEMRIKDVAEWAETLPGFENYQERVAQQIKQYKEHYNQFIDPRNPATYQAVVESVLRDLMYDDWKAEQAAQVQQSANAAQVPPAKRTATKNTATRTEPSTTAEQIQDMIANATI